MATTKINTLKQLRKAPNNGVVLATEGDKVKWKPISDITDSAKATARTIANEVVDAKKAEIIAQVNTARYVGPVADTGTVDVSTVDENDLVLVGTKAPYAIYAKINGSLVELGQTEVDLSDYVTTTALDQRIFTAKTEIDNDVENLVRLDNEMLESRIKEDINHSVDEKLLEKENSILSKIKRYTIGEKVETIDISNGNRNIAKNFTIPGLDNSRYENQTVFDLYLNGVLLEKGVDYTLATSVGDSGVSIVLTEAGEAGDKLTVVRRAVVEYDI